MKRFLVADLVMLLVVLFIGCIAIGDTLTAPNAQTLSVSRGSTAASGSALTLSYNSGGGRVITVSAAVGSGTPVAGAVLSIQGGDLGTTGWTELITGSTAVGTDPTLKSSTAGGGGSISDIKFQLDATNVSVGAANLGTPWTYTVTYTISTP